MQAAIGKGVGSALTAGVVGYMLARQAGSLTIPITLASALSGFLFYARVWIQGYYFDKRYRPSPDQTGRVALVTGGTIGGLGFAAAKILADMNAVVIVTVRSDKKGKEAVAKLGKNASYIVCDFASTASIQAAAAKLGSLERLDLLVLNAGIGGSKEDPGKVFRAPCIF